MSYAVMARTLMPSPSPLHRWQGKSRGCECHYGKTRGRDQVAIMRKCQTESTIGGLMNLAGRTNRTKFRDQVLKPLLSADFIEMTIPDKPRSSQQKYRLTEKGRASLRKAT